MENGDAKQLVPDSHSGLIAPSTAFRTETMMQPTRREFLTTTAGACAATALGAHLEARAAAVANPDDLTALSLSDASDLLQARRISPVELTTACLSRIERLNPALNAFITVTGEQALTDARTAESDIARGRRRGPLHGIPIALKDLFDTAGVRTTAGSAVFTDRVPGEDAEVVRRLKAAGAIVLGKLNMHEFAYGDTSAQTHFGPVRNPWDRTRVPGGSSGGSAAAVAARLCYGALGSDTGGSIRQPAAYCAIVGLKPTYGLVSTRGVVPLSWSLDHVGPMCRTVANAATLLQPLAGYDAGDTNSIDAAIPDYRRGLRQKVSALRIGIPRAVFYDVLDPDIDAAVREALRVIAKLTASTHDVELPAYRTLPVAGAEAYAFHAPYFTKTPQLYQSGTRQRLEGGAMVSASAYIDGRRELERLRRAVMTVFRDVDLLVTPTTPILPQTVDEAVNNPSIPPAGGVALSLRNTQPFDIYGLPSISIPCGFSRSGLPIGLEISGPRLGESQVLALAYAYEQATDWHRRTPAL
jgi:aspartyl-tRNA(Asn)/glutamyl-tRNA(Gln) amidotransferase subunit A